MSEIYSIYESSFKTLSRKIDSLLNINEFNEKNITELRGSIQEINRIIKQMSLEINNLKLTTNKKISKEIEDNLNKYKNIVQDYNSKLALIQDYKFRKSNNSSNKILIDDDEKFQNQGLIEDEYIQQTKINTIGREMADIEQIGNNINNGLLNQGEQMHQMRDNVFLMKNEADKSNDLINKIMKLAKKNKIKMYGSVALFVLIFIMILIMKFK